ncbi:uncharacterized protein LOC120839879 [Ixodes scapularis]|uniref:uncharacterized protein LOC120839879 n=1 Tax=Ixodes scapularis TaxID=6945 RepID=UPI001A9F71C2|nr:uncharacterized protein LOC120839879 [Ixodes scapularis]
MLVWQQRSGTSYDHRLQKEASVASSTRLGAGMTHAACLRLLLLESYLCEIFRLHPVGSRQPPSGRQPDAGAWRLLFGPLRGEDGTFKVCCPSEDIGSVDGGQPRTPLPDSVGAQGPARTATEPDGELQRETAHDGRQEALVCLVRGKLGRRATVDGKWGLLRGKRATTDVRGGGDRDVGTGDGPVTWT